MGTPSMEVARTNGQERQIYGLIVQTEQQQELAKQLRQNTKSMVALLGASADPDKVVASVLLAVAENPDLLKCNRTSLIISVMRAVQMGLDCSGTLGSAYLVPFKGKVQLIPGYRGLVDKAIECGAAAKVWAETYCENDDFEYEEGTSPYIRHRKCLSGSRGRFIAAYACAKVGTGDVQFTIIPALEMEGFTRDSQPWRDNFLEMAKKTAVRRLMKQLSLNPDRHAKLGRVLELDDRADQGLLLREDEERLREMNATAGALEPAARMDQMLGQPREQASLPAPVEASPAAQIWIEHFSRAESLSAVGAVKNLMISDDAFKALPPDQKNLVMAAERAARERLQG